MTLKQYFPTDKPYRPTCPGAYILPETIYQIINDEVQRPAAPGEFEAAQTRLAEVQSWLAENGQVYEADFEGWLAALGRGENPFAGAEGE